MVPLGKYQFSPQVVESLQTHTDSLNKALGAVAEVQTSQKFIVASLQAEMEAERIARTHQRRTIEDLQTELNRLKEESKARNRFTLFCFDYAFKDIMI